MSVASDLAYLLISSSVESDTTRRADLVASTTCFGRPGSAARGFDFVDLELPNVSRKHARIVYDRTAYHLEKWDGAIRETNVEKEHRCAHYLPFTSSSTPAAP
jgi:hypothetical protein